MNEKELAAVKQALEALEKSLPRLAPYGEQDWLDSCKAITALQSIISQDALHKMAEESRTSGLRLDDWDKIGCVNHDCDQCKAVQEHVAHQVIAGALFDFMGWLTSRNERLVLSSTDDASPAVEAITEFAKMRGLSLDGARVQDWQNTTPPAQPAPVQEPVAQDVQEKCRIEDVPAKGGLMPTPPTPQPVPVKTYHDGKPWPVAPKPWVGLTDDDVADIWNRYCDEMGHASINDAEDIARAIEAMLKEKNA